MCICQRKFTMKNYNEMIKNWIKILKNVNSNKRILKGYICQYWQRYNPIVDGRIIQYMHQIAIYLHCGPTAKVE